MFIRNIKDVSEAEITHAVTSLTDVGFINYFGMQRFGTSAVPTHEVGKAILASKWEEAVDLILSAASGWHSSISGCYRFRCYIDAVMVEHIVYAITFGKYFAASETACFVCTFSFVLPRTVKLKMVFLLCL